MVEKQCLMKKKFARIGINTGDDLPLNVTLKLPTLRVVIRCVLQKGKKLYSQIYLEKCLHEL